ncbi:PIG-L deacetylase family protein [Microbacterium paulum]
MSTWILSPHADDAALSLAVALRSEVFPEPIGVVTAYSVSTFAVDEGRSQSSITAMRTAEDSRFAAAFDVSIRQLGLRDAPLRRSIKGTDVFDLRLPVLSRSVNALARRVRSIQNDWSKTTLVVPSGVGGHIDHRVAARASDGLPASSVFAYADQPYAIQDPRLLDQLRERRGEPDWSATASTRNVAVKVEASEYYPSQPAAARMIAALGVASPPTILEAVWRIQ